MNTRKPSEPIDLPPGSTTSIAPVISAQVKRLVLVTLVSAVMLTGCSTGAAPEATRGKQQDANRESVISDLQATHTWELIHGTPESTPEQ